MPGGQRYRHVKTAISNGNLHTVCKEAKCPNMGECWEAGTAAFMILGDTCTRGCRFCAVTRGNPRGIVDTEEPRKIALAVEKMGLDYAVVTSVTRDDLPDGGASVFAKTVFELKTLPAKPMVELLTPDYTGDPLKKVLSSKPEVFAHNVEVVERLSPTMRHKRFSYKNSLQCLTEAANSGSALTKSSIMLGLGETDREIEDCMNDLLCAGVGVLVIGQYLQPTKKHAEVQEYIHPDVFDQLADRGKKLGFKYVAASPLARTSYKAAEAYVRRRLSR